MVPVILGLLAILRFVTSKKEERVRARKELEDYYKDQIEQPFMEGYRKDEELTEWIRMDVPQGKSYVSYRTLSSLSFGSILLVFVAAANKWLPQDCAWAMTLPVPIGAFFLYLMWRQRAHRSLVKVWRGTKEPASRPTHGK